MNPEEYTDSVLSSLRWYDTLRETAIAPQEEGEQEQNTTATTTTVIRRDPVSKVDVLTTTNAQNETTTVAICHLSVLSPWMDSVVDTIVSYPALYAIAKALEDLNSGNGTFVPALQNLPQTCPIRFTAESVNTEGRASTALRHVMNQTSRPPPYVGQKQRLPCAFVGPLFSSVAIPTGMVTGVLGYPQVSALSTSAELNDKSNYPLFGRTVPADDDNAISSIIFLDQIMKIETVVVVNDNTSYGNAWADAMRRAATRYAPHMSIVQVTVDIQGDGTGIASAVQRIKETQYRFIFLVTQNANQDDFLAEAVKQGIAGDGEHVWMGHDTFILPEESVHFEDPQDPLFRAYLGSARIMYTGGIYGEETFDKFFDSLLALKNPSDVEFLENQLYPDLISPKNVLEDQMFLSKAFDLNYLSFYYEAVVALGLAACQALTPDFVLMGEAHYQAFKNLSFSAISGTVRFDPETGSRDPTGLLYKVTNVVSEQKEDGLWGFKHVISHVFRDLKWEQKAEYVFNDGTTIIPLEFPPPLPDETTFADEYIILIVVGAIVLILIMIFVLLYHRKRKADDSIQKVKLEELVFLGDPPHVLGRGTFGLVLLAEYRGTKVAVKSLLGGGGNAGFGATLGSGGGGGSSSASLRKQDGYIATLPGTESGMLSNTSRQWKATESGMLSSNTSRQCKATESGMLSGSGGSGSNNRKKQKKNNLVLTDEIMDEMRILSKLRHPCVTTFMGIVMGGEETQPMLLMEYMEYGSLYDVLHNKTVIIDGEIILPILRDITQGVRFLHLADPQLIHGDLKCANILLDSRFRAKVADFGLSAKTVHGGTGTPFWMAPELLRKETGNTAQSDVYSFGVILYEVYSRKNPYEGEKMSEVLSLVADPIAQKRPGVPEQIPAPLQSIMADCLVNDPDRRPAFEEIDTRLKRLTSVDATPTNLSKRVPKSSHTQFDKTIPAHIAEALQDGRQVEPEHKDIVTVGVLDVVGFEELFARWSKTKGQELLSRFHKKLNSLCDKLDVFRIKTTEEDGSYMVVSNLVKDQSFDHCKRIVHFATEAFSVAKETLLDENDAFMGNVVIRVVIHSGPAIAGVVGHRNPRFCLFGDTVNMVMSMVNIGDIGRIVLSKRAADILTEEEGPLLLDKLEDRGQVRISEKGTMQCYALVLTTCNETTMMRSMVRKQARFLSRLGFDPTDETDNAAAAEPGKEATQLPEQALPTKRELIGLVALKETHHEGDEDNDDDDEEASKKIGSREVFDSEVESNDHSEWDDDVNRSPV